MQRSFLLKRKLGEQEDGEDSDHGSRRCNEGDEVRHCPLLRSISYSQAGSAVFLLLGDTDYQVLGPDSGSKVLSATLIAEIIKHCCTTSSSNWRKIFFL